MISSANVTTRRVVIPVVEQKPSNASARSSFRMRTSRRAVSLGARCRETTWRGTARRPTPRAHRHRCGGRWPATQEALRVENAPAAAADATQAGKGQPAGFKPRVIAKAAKDGACPCGTMWPGSSHAPAMASALGGGGLIGRPASIRLSHPAERLAVGKCHARTPRGLSGRREAAGGARFSSSLLQLRA
jgi:hypothetical protein